MVVLAVALAFWSKSRNLKIASLIVALDWLLSNYFTTNYGAAGVNYIAPMNVLFFGLFLFLFRAKSLRGQSYYRRLLFFYFLYLTINFWHLAGRFFYPETLAASYYFVLLASNIVFILIIVTLWILAFLKGVGNRTEGGLMAVYDDWALRISNFKREYSATTSESNDEEQDLLEPLWSSFKKHILKRPAKGESDHAPNGTAVARDKPNKPLE